MDIGQRKEAVIGGDDKIAKHSEAHAETSYRALNGRHNRQRKMSHFVNHRMQQSHKLLECLIPLPGRLLNLLVEQFDVATGHEALACAFQQHAARRRILVEFQKHFRKIRHHLVIQRIQVLGTVKHDLVDRAFLPGKNGVHSSAREYIESNHPVRRRC